jgi:hypothetical protein
VIARNAKGEVMSIEALEGITDQELFDQANADEVPVDEPVAETIAETEQADRARDEQGRFAAKAADEPETPVAAETAARPAVDDNAPQVPSWRVREINDEKRQIAERLAAKEAAEASWQAERQQMLQRLAALEKPPAQPEKVERPDPLLDPEGYAKAIREEIRQEAIAERREESLQRAHKTYKTEFEEAYAAAQKQVDPGLRARMQQSRDPGETLIEWHREQKTRAEVGNDLAAFREREQERLLSDPAFLAKAIEKARGVAQPATQPGAKVPSATSLPPSLTRATNASTITSADDNDVSDEGLWRHANA